MMRDSLVDHGGHSNEPYVPPTDNRPAPGLGNFGSDAAP